MDVNLPLLSFRPDGVYLDDKRLTFVTELYINSNADKSTEVSELQVVGYKSDRDGRPIVGEYGDFMEYEIDAYVVIEGLDTMYQSHKFNK